MKRSRFSEGQITGRLKEAHGGGGVKAVRAPKPRAARRGRRSGGTGRSRATAANNHKPTHQPATRTIVLSCPPNGGRSVCVGARCSSVSSSIYTSMLLFDGTARRPLFDVSDRSCLKLISRSTPGLQTPPGRARASMIPLHHGVQFQCSQETPGMIKQLD
jgi:hypothetical protein